MAESPEPPFPALRVDPAKDGQISHEDILHHATGPGLDIYYANRKSSIMVWAILVYVPTPGRYAAISTIFTDLYAAMACFVEAHEHYGTDPLTDHLTLVEYGNSVIP